MQHTDRKMLPTENDQKHSSDPTRNNTTLTQTEHIPRIYVSFDGKVYLVIGLEV